MANKPAFTRTEKMAKGITPNPKARIPGGMKLQGSGVHIGYFGKGPYNRQVLLQKEGNPEMRTMS